MGFYGTLVVLSERRFDGKKRSKWRNIAEIWAVKAHGTLAVLFECGFNGENARNGVISRNYGLSRHKARLLCYLKAGLTGKTLGMA